MSRTLACTVGSVLLAATLIVAMGVSPPDPAPPAAKPPAAEGKRTLLAFSDFQYVGAFCSPRIFSNQPYGSRYGFCRPAMCWNPKGDSDGENDGFPGSIMIVGHPRNGLIGEFSIPVPKRLTDADKQNDGTHDTRKLPSGKQLGNFFDPSMGKKNVLEKRAENWRGLWWDGDVLHLSWSLWYHVDSEVKNYPNKMAVKRLADGTWQEVIAPYSFPHIGPHRIAGYVSAAPKWWAAKHLGGRRMLAGFNVAQGTGSSNDGPGLYAYDPKAPQDAIILMQFPHSRSGKTSDEKWRPCDAWRGLAFIDTGSKYAIVLAGRKSLGQTYYGVGRPGDASKSKGYHCDPYRPEVRFYDPAVFLEVIAGTKEPHEPRPYEKVDLTATFFQPDKAFGTCGIGYDPVHRLVYIAQLRGDSDSSRYEAAPAIHVWRIK